MLERLQAYKGDVLRFLEDPSAPFTHNQGERDLRMTKVQQKISACFRSQEGADIFYRMRSLLATAIKQRDGSACGAGRPVHGKAAGLHAA